MYRFKFENYVTTYLCSGYVLIYGPHCTNYVSMCSLAFLITIRPITIHLMIYKCHKICNYDQKAENSWKMARFSRKMTYRNA